MVFCNYLWYYKTNKRYHTLDYYYKQKYGTKIIKISLNGNFSCPNLDGTVGYGGCIYCSKTGSGEFAGKKEDSITEQFLKGKKKMHDKWKEGKYIAYFQARTNTYAPINRLKELYEEAINQENVVGLNIATRPDSITEECLDYLEELNKRIDVTIELGLQTIKEETSKIINRCHSIDCFEKMVKKLRKRNIPVVAHIINGLPYETKEDMLNTIKYLNKIDIQGSNSSDVDNVNTNINNGDVTPVDNNPVTKDEIDQTNDDNIDIQNNKLTNTYNDMMSRMNNLYNDNNNEEEI